MKVSIRLVGYFEIIDDTTKYIYEINYENEHIFNFEIFKEKIINLDPSCRSDESNIHNLISDDELNICTIISNSRNLKKESIIDDNKTQSLVYIVYIYCMDQDIKNKLISIFKSHGKRSLYEINMPQTCANPSLICEKLTDQLKSQEIINYKPNFELFTNDDFISLIKIYKLKPDIFKDFYKFISSEISSERSVLVSDDINEDPNKQCNLECIKKYNFNITDEYIEESLQKNNNNLGLTLKYILSQI